MYSFGRDACGVMSVRLCSSICSCGTGCTHLSPTVDGRPAWLETLCWSLVVGAEGHVASLLSGSDLDSFVSGSMSVSDVVVVVGTVFV